MSVINSPSLSKPTDTQKTLINEGEPDPLLEPKSFEWNKLPSMRPVDPKPRIRLPPPFPSEQNIVKDLIYILQGISGKMIQFSSSNKIIIDFTNFSLDEVKKKLVIEISVLGWYYKLISSYLENRLSLSFYQRDRNEIGLVELHCKEAINEEILDYYRSTTVLGTEASNNNTLTLRQIYVWIQEPYEKLRTICGFIDSLQILRNTSTRSVPCSIFEALLFYRNQSSPVVYRLMDRILKKSMKPFLHITYRWVFDGVLQDSLNEFFITSKDEIHKGNKSWDSYVLSEERIPPFVSKELAQLILGIGKSQNLLRMCKKDASWVEGHLNKHFNDARMLLGGDQNKVILQKLEIIKVNQETEEKRQLGWTPHKQLEGGWWSTRLTKRMKRESEQSVDEQEQEYDLKDETKWEIELKQTMQTVAEIVDGRVLTMMIDEYQILDHVIFLKGFLLLQQSNFCIELIHHLRKHTELHGPFFYEHNLAEIISTALSLPNLSSYPQSLIKRLKATIENPAKSATKTGLEWGKLKLSYQTDFPMNILFSVPVIQKYEQFYHFLWTIQKANYFLREMWKLHMHNRKTVLPDTKPLVDKFYTVRFELGNFFSSLWAYICSVISSEWNQFQSQFLSSKSIESFISLHNSYLKNLSTNILLEELRGDVIDIAEHISKSYMQQSNLFIGMRNIGDLQKKTTQKATTQTAAKRVLIQTEELKVLRERFQQPRQLLRGFLYRLKN
eukprot:TRINITY_DN1161_c0_g1_i4.p1 TRINITY_DN1161_c0_g1~~TRINITY_DN1161_c0_g1_i4.p1  ORF type:complete len:727 (+),score=165.48 TRINITY_DN1161_c0_g1_i4:2626-4806(+)